MIFHAMRVYDIAVEGITTHSRRYSREEYEGYEAPSDHAFLILIQVISSPVLQKVTNLSIQIPTRYGNISNRHIIGIMSFSFIYQVAGLCRRCTELEQVYDTSVLHMRGSSSYLRDLDKHD